MKIEGVIFDWAGTTMDYGCFSPVGAFMEAFKSEGIDITIEEAREPMGLLKIEHTKALLKMDRIAKNFETINGRKANDEDVNRLYKKFEDTLFKTLGDYTSLNPYLIEIVDYLKERGIKIGSTTGYTKEMMDTIMPKTSLNGYTPDFCVASDQVENGRPYPDMIRENMKALGIEDSSKIIKVGDTVVDIKEGIQAGCYSVGVVLGSSELGLTKEEVDSMEKDKLDVRVMKVREKLLSAGANYIIEDLRGLPKVIEDIENEIGYRK